MRIDSPSVSNLTFQAGAAVADSAFTGSFTGSFVGDGSSLTGITVSGYVDTSGTPVANDFARFTDADTIEGRSYSEVRSDLSLVIGTDVQAYDAQLDDLSGLAVTDGGFIVGDGSNFVLETGATARTSIGLGTSGHVQFHCLGIGTAASTVNGEIRAAGDITAYYSSDERLKENVAPLSNVLDKVNNLNGVSFDWKEGIDDVTSKSGHDIGVIAQEIQAEYPELVTERDNGYLAVDYVKLTAVLLQAVKELSAKVDALS